MGRIRRAHYHCGPRGRLGLSAWLQTRGRSCDHGTLSERNPIDARLTQDSSALIHLECQAPQQVREHCFQQDAGPRLCVCRHHARNGDFVAN
jgi:hypothetical protein